MERSVKFQEGSAVSLRKRLGRGGRVMIDRRGLIRKHDAVSIEQVEQGYSGENNSTERFQDRYKFDSDLHTDNMDFPGSEPSRLNGISDDDRICTIWINAIKQGL